MVVLKINSCNNYASISTFVHSYAAIYSITLKNVMQTFVLA